MVFCDEQTISLNGQVRSTLGQTPDWSGDRLISPGEQGEQPTSLADASPRPTLRAGNWVLSIGDWVMILNVTQLDTREKLAFRDERVARYRDYNERTFRIGEFYLEVASRSARFHHSQC
jgi:hypothetical protein